jgi:hypothetical protein
VRNNGDRQRIDCRKINTRDFCLSWHRPVNQNGCQANTRTALICACIGLGCTGLCATIRLRGCNVKMNSLNRGCAALFCRKMPTVNARCSMRRVRWNKCQSKSNRKARKYPDQLRNGISLFHFGQLTRKSGAVKRI